MLCALPAVSADAATWNDEAQSFLTDLAQNPPAAADAVSAENLLRLYLRAWQLVRDPEAGQSAQPELSRRVSEAFQALGQRIRLYAENLWSEADRIIAGMQRRIRTDPEYLPSREEILQVMRLWETAKAVWPDEPTLLQTLEDRILALKREDARRRPPQPPAPECYAGDDADELRAVARRAVMLARPDLRIESARLIEPHARETLLLTRAPDSSWRVDRALELFAHVVARRDSQVTLFTVRLRRIWEGQAAGWGSPTAEVIFTDRCATEDASS